MASELVEPGGPLHPIEIDIEHGPDGSQDLIGNDSLEGDDRCDNPSTHPFIDDGEAAEGQYSLQRHTSSSVRLRN